MSKKKVSAGRIPVSKADVIKAQCEGYNFGFQFAMTLSLYVLKEKHDAPDDDIIQFFHEVETEIEDIAHGFSNYKDVHDYVRDELNIEVKVRPGFRPKDRKDYEDNEDN